jgi:peptidoglycan/LPS O-acetylase OafA/YrhL
MTQPMADPASLANLENESPGPRNTSFRLGNRPSLTGIRALALSTVLIYHSNFKSLPGTWVSLQIFFVLSGFLITAMLASEGKRMGRISLTGFYARRAVRLMPPLLLVIGLLAIYAHFVHVADAAHRIWGDSLAALFYFADYRQAFGHAPFFGYLAQTWSLSVEEQFYILWSLLMVVALVSRRPKLAYLFAIIGIIASTADRTWLVLHAHPFTDGTFLRTYYAFDPRADALFFGCLLGLLAADGWLLAWPRWATKAITVAAAASVAAIVWVLLYAPLFDKSVVLWWVPVTTLASGVLIVYFVVCPKSLGTRFAGLGIFVFVGNLSYTVYLLHFPVYLATMPSELHWPFWAEQVLRQAIIFSIAIASWFLMEKPLMRWRAKSAKRDGAA